jgi:hypothetical protein
MLLSRLYPRIVPSLPPRQIPRPCVRGAESLSIANPAVTNSLQACHWVCI